MPLTTMPFCHQCGNECSNDATFCVTCEAASAKQSDIASASVPAVPPKFASPQQYWRFSRMPLFREMATRIQTDREIQFRYDEGNDAFPHSAITADDKMSIDELIPSLTASHSGQQAETVVAITARDLAKSGCGSLFGYANPHLGICVVSTARLGTTAEEVAPRLENVIPHEIVNR